MEARDKKGEVAYTSEKDIVVEAIDLLYDLIKKGYWEEERGYIEKL
jgi:hypothetical protein